MGVAEFVSMVDAYGTLMAGSISTATDVFGPLPDPPALPPGLTEEQHAAHRAIYDLMSIEQFQREREKPGFICLNDYWGAIGMRKFCCEVAVLPVTPGDPFGQRGYSRAQHYTACEILNEGWRLKLEEAPPPKLSWWRRAWDWLLRPIGWPLP